MDHGHGARTWWRELVQRPNAKAGIDKRIKKRRESIRAGKIRDEYEHLDQEISRILGETGGTQEAEFGLHAADRQPGDAVVSNDRLQIQLRTGMMLDESVNKRGLEVILLSNGNRLPGV